MKPCIRQDNNTYVFYTLPCRPLRSRGWLYLLYPNMWAWNWNVTDSKQIFLIWLLPDIFRYDSPKKCPTNLYTVNTWLKPVSATGAISYPTPRSNKRHMTAHSTAHHHIPAYTNACFPMRLYFGYIILTSYRYLGLQVLFWLIRHFCLCCQLQANFIYSVLLMCGVCVFSLPRWVVRGFVVVIVYGVVPPEFIKSLLKCCNWFCMYKHFW